MTLVTKEKQLPHVIAFGTDGEDMVPVATDADGNLGARNFIWNTSTLAWEKATGSLTGGSNVTVNNFPAVQPVSGTVTANAGTDLNTSLLSTAANQTNGTQKTQIVDGSGNVIGSTHHEDGTHHLDASVIQDVIVIAGNSSTANLNAGATFTGTATTTLGVNAIQVMLKTDVNCNVYIDQSSDGTNWDLSDQYTYYYSINNFGVTVQAIGSYFRVRVTNIGATNSTYFRLQSVICPMAEPLPRSLDRNGNLLTAVHTIEDEYGFEVENSPNGEMRVVIPTKLIGASFEGTTLDPNFWTATVANSGTVAVANAECTISTNTTADGSAKLNSFRRARYIVGQAQVARLQIQLNNTGVANNIRKWGVAWGATMPTITDGAYFQLSGTTFSIVTLKGSSPTIVSSGDFNGTYGSTYALDTNIHTYEIYWNNRSVFFTIDGEVLHTVAASAATWTNTVQHHIYIDSVNSGGITSNNTIKCRAASVRRLGNHLSQPTSKFQSGTTAGVVCKYGLGSLHGICVSGVQNNSAITLYDNTSASGTVLWQSGAMGTQTTPFDIAFHGLPFNNGLTLVIASANSDVTLIYE